MSATAASVLMLVGLIVFNGAPLVFGLLAARSNARYGSGTVTNAVFWAIVGSYLGLLALLSVGLLDTVSHPQPEGLAAFSFIAVLAVGGVPGSILPLLAGIEVEDQSLPRPFGLSSMSTWLVIGILCWQFFLIVGVRWLVQIRARGRARAVRAAVPVPPVESLDSR